MLGAFYAGSSYAGGLSAVGSACTLDVQSTLHTHYADDAAVAIPGVIVADTSGHAHFAENIELIQQHTLQVNDATHGHTVLNATLIIHLIISNAYHQSIADEAIVLQRACDKSPRVVMRYQKPLIGFDYNGPRVNVKSHVGSPRVK